MEPLTIVFDEITQVRRVRSTKFGPAHTIFSFRSQSKLIRDVRVPGHPRLVPGMRVRALLRTSGNWRTLVGWVDLDSGSIEAPRPQEHLVNLAVLIGLLLAFAIAWAFSGFSTADLKRSDWIPIGLLLLGWLFVLGVQVRDYFVERADLAALSALARE